MLYKYTWDLEFCQKGKWSGSDHHLSLLSDKERHEHSDKLLVLSSTEESHSHGFKMTTVWVDVSFLFIPKSTAILHHAFTLYPNPSLFPFLPCLPLYQCQGEFKPSGKISCSCMCTSTQHNSWRTLNWTGNRGSRAFAVKQLEVL